MKFFFIDLENVRSEGLEGVLSLAGDDMVFIFYSDNAMNLSIPTMENLNNSKASKKFIKTNYIGKNAMDFQIVSLFGAMIEREKAGSYYIISQDNGFRSAVSFCESYFEEYGVICGVAPTIIAAITDELKKSTEAGKNGKNRKNASNQKASAVQKNKQANKQETDKSVKSDDNGEKVNSPDNTGEAETTGALDTVAEGKKKKKRHRTKKAKNTECSSTAGNDESGETADGQPTEAKNTGSGTAKKENVNAVRADSDDNGSETRVAVKVNPRQYIYDILGELLSEKTIDIYAQVIDEGIAKCNNKDELHVFFLNHFGDDEGEALYRVVHGDFDKMKQLRPGRASHRRHHQKRK